MNVLKRGDIMLYVSIILSLLMINVCANSSNQSVRKLDSEVDYSDELGRFYYPVTYIKLPEGQEQTLTPINTNYTLKSDKTLSADELSIDKSTGVVTVKHLTTSTKGEVTITVTCSNEYEFTVVIDFLESKYLLGATTIYQTPFFVRSCPVPHASTIVQKGDAITTAINMFRIDQDLDDLLKFVGTTITTDFIYINITGYVKVDKDSTYTFYLQSAYNAQIEVNDQVIISNYDVCPDISTESQGSIELTKGYHKVLLHAVGGKKQNITFDGVEKLVGGWGFDFKYQIDDGEKEYISLYSEPDYSYANSLLFFKSSYSWGLNILQSIEFTVKNAIECKSEPELPEGIELTTKMITGTSKVTFKKSFIISCYSYHSTTNHFNITIDVTDIFLPGLVGYYMKYDIYTPPQSFMLKRNDPSAHLKVLCIESNINKEYSELPVSWKGLGAEFISEFGVHWEGVIKYPKKGTYTFRVTCDDSCYLKINNDYKLRLYGTGNVTRDYKYTVGENNGEYEYILLEYSQYKGSSVFEFLLKGPDDNDFRYPEDLLFYNPPGDLQYTYIVAVYLMNVDLPASNKPIISGIDTTTDKPLFSINKDLPEGITLDPNTGDIEGKPLVSQKRDEYLITAEFTNHAPVSVVIFITVEDVPVPKDVYFYNPATDEKYTSKATLHLGSFISLQAGEDSGTTIAGYFYEGNLPTTTFNEDTGVLSGVLNELGTFSVTIMAKNGAGTATSIIEITVENICETGKTTVLFSLPGTAQKFQFSIVDQTGKTIVAPIDISQEADWNKDMCLPENMNYIAKVWNNIPHDFFFFLNIYSNGKNILKERRSGSAIDGGSYDYSFKTTSTPSPISYGKTNFVWEQYASSTEKPSYYNTLVNFKIDPSYLPNGVSFGSDGIFTGVTKETFPKTKYNITATTLYGDVVSLVITIEVTLSSCSRHGNSLIHVNAFVQLPFHANFMYVSIKDSSNTIVMEIATKELNADHDFYKCVAPGDYLLHCESPDVSGFGWSDSYIDVFLDDAPMGHCNIQQQEVGPVIYEAALHLSYNININTEWEYSSKLDQGWNTVNFNLPWNKAKIENIPTNGNSLYLRKLIPIHDVDTFSAFYSRFDILSGLIYYINGIEMGRVNLPAGSLSDTQTATKFFASLTPVSFVLPIAMFEKQEALVAIELHRYDETEQFNVIALYTVDLNGDGIYNLLYLFIDQESCTRLHSFGKVTNIDPPAANDRNKAAFAMDSQSGTFYQGQVRTMKGANPSMTISFGENRHVFINRFMYVGTMKSQFKQGPQSIQFYEKIPTGWYKIGNMDIPEPQDSSEIRSTDIYENNYLTNELQINFTAYPKQSIFKIYDIMPGVCHIFYCMKNDYLPYTEGGKNVTVACPNGATGERTFLCPTGRNPQWREIANSCPVAPEVLSKIDSYEFEIGKTETVTLFTYSGFIKTLTVSPILPSCIKLESYIFGIYIADKCYDELASTEYTFTLTNDYGTQTVSTKLAINPTNKPVIMEPLSSYVFYIGTNVDVNLFKVLGSNLEILVTPALPKGLALDPYTGKITGTAVEELEETNYLFSVSNSYDKIIVSIKLSVTVTNKPVILEAPADKNTFIYGFTYNELYLYRVVGKSLKYYIQSGELPKDLKLDESTGKIFGKVTSKDSSSSSSFVVAVTSDGSEKIEMIINYEIVQSDRPYVIDNKEEQVFEFGKEITDLKLFDIAGDNITYSVTPSLPEGLVLDEKTGLISGSVKANTGNKMYTFYFRNANGIESCRILLSFNIPVIPIILTYKKEITFVKSVYIEPTSILTVSGKDIKYKVTPDLPNGMRLKENTGAISGTPIENIKETYDFMVYNSNGGNNASIVIEIITKYCERTGDWEKTEISSKSYAGCSGAYSGNKYRSCLVTDNGEAIWGGIIDDCSLQTGLIVGIVIICIVVVALIVLVVVFCVYRRNAIKKVNSDKRKQVIADKGIHM